MPLTNGSGSGFDPDLDSSIFIIDLQDANKKIILKKVDLHNTVLFEDTFT
jgi:hypothetical protein